MSIASEITRIKNNIASAYTAVNTKGGTLPATQNSNNLATAINSIPSGGATLQSKSVTITQNGNTNVAPDTGYDGLSSVAITTNVSGGGSAEGNDVNFYDYDGTIVASYSASDFANLSALPDNPTHTGLTSQGWNWTLTDAKTYVANYGMLEIGQMYVTDDGATRIYIHLEDGRLEPYLGVALSGTVNVDWGDGNSEDVTGTSTSTVTSTKHTYASAGDYVIKIKEKVFYGSYYFLGNSSYGSQVLWNNLTSSVSSNKAYQNAIRKVEIGAKCHIKASVFNGCSSLTSITMPSNSNITTVEAYAFRNCSSLTSITMPNRVTEINSYAFNECSSLKSIAVPKSVTYFNSGIFSNCSSLTSATMPNSVVLFDTSIFNGCSSLTSITMPSNITSIGNSTFNKCSSLTSITIPSGVTSIGSNAFNGCSSLTSITIPSGVTSIEASVFNSCSSLTSITIPSGVTSIGSNAFNRCSLTSVAISSGVTSLGNYAFGNCSFLTSVIMPSSVTSIGDYAFTGCYSIGYYDFTSHTSVPTLGTNAFLTIANDCKIVVPDNLYEEWVVATNWSNYASKIIKESEWNA